MQLLLIFLLTYGVFATEPNATPPPKADSSVATGIDLVGMLIGVLGSKGLSIDQNIIDNRVAEAYAKEDLDRFREKPFVFKANETVEDRVQRIEEHIEWRNRNISRTEGEISSLQQDTKKLIRRRNILRGIGVVSALHFFLGTSASAEAELFENTQSEAIIDMDKVETNIGEN